MRIDVLTIFPELFDSFFTTGIVERGRVGGQLELHTTDLRAFTSDRHHSVDDRPYGGGPGMLLKPEPVVRAVELLVGELGASALVALCPQGETLKQKKLEELARLPRLLLLCIRNRYSPRP